MKGYVLSLDQNSGMRILIIIVWFFGTSKLLAQPPSPVGPVPSKAQLAWHDMELTAFIHFTTNTFTDKEWGFGDESPSIFNPSACDPEQWARALKEAGFKMMILTTKHHDGFCLWPSRYTEHSVKNSPYKGGKGDIVKETRDAAAKYGLKFGIYLSPWDRNHYAYGSQEYLTYYRNQLKELFTQYGPITEMWFDGANGGDGYYGGAREVRQIERAKYYEWPVTLDLVKKMEPNVLFFSDAGPHIRWAGNEKGRVAETNWNTLTPDTLYAGQSGIEELLGTGSPDGSHWIPAECDFSIRPGWFYHAAEDEKVKSGEELFERYLTSVGRGSNMLLNVPPDRRGLFHDNDLKSLVDFKAILQKELGQNLAKGVKVKSSHNRGNDVSSSAAHLTDGDNTTYWATEDDVIQSQVELDLGTVRQVKYVVLQEYISLGQRIEKVMVEAMLGGQWKEVARATTIGHKRILQIKPVETQQLRISVVEAKGCVVLSEVGVY